MATLAEVAPLQKRSTVSIPCTLRPEAVSVIPDVGVGVGVGVTVAIGVAVAVAVAVGVAVAVAVAVAAAVAVAVGVGVGATPTDCLSWNAHTPIDPCIKVLVGRGTSIVVVPRIGRLNTRIGLCR